MTIARDTETVATAYTSTGTQTTSHTGSSSTKAVVVLIDQNGTTTDEVSGVTYGGTAMLRLDSNSEATEAGRVYTYYLLNPPTGTQNVAMTTTAATNKQLVCATMTGDPLKAIKVAGFNFGTSAAVANPTWNITGLTAATKLEAYEVIHSGLQTMTNTPESPWTLVSSTDLGSQGRGFARQSVASSGTTLSSGWTAATSEDYVGMSVAFWEDVNLVPDENSSFEGGTTGTWESNGIYTPGTLSNSATHADVGTKALLMTWPTTGSGSIADVDVLGMVDGQDYKLSGRIWVPSGHPDVRAEVIFFGAGSYVSTKGAFADASVTFTANSLLHALCGFQVASATSGQQVWIDNVRVVAVFTYQITASGSNTSNGSAAITIFSAGTTYQITASGTGTTTGTAAISTATTLTAAGANTNTGTAAITRTTTMSAAGSNTNTGTAAITRTTLMSAAGSNTNTGTAAITITSGPQTFQVTASGAGTTTGTAAITADLLASAAGSNATTGTADITRTTTLSASGINVTTGDAAITIPGPPVTYVLDAAGTNITDGTADITISATYLITAAGLDVMAGNAAFVELWQIAAAGTNTNTGTAAIMIIPASGVPVGYVTGVHEGVRTVVITEGPRAVAVREGPRNVAVIQGERTVTMIEGN